MSDRRRRGGAVPSCSDQPDLGSADSDTARRTTVHRISRIYSSKGQNTWDKGYVTTFSVRVWRWLKKLIIGMHRSTNYRGRTSSPTQHSVSTYILPWYFKHLSGQKPALIGIWAHGIRHIQCFFRLQCLQTTLRLHFTIFIHQGTWAQLNQGTTAYFLGIRIKYVVLEICHYIEKISTSYSQGIWKSSAVERKQIS